MYSSFKDAWTVFYSVSCYKLLGIIKHYENNTYNASHEVDNKYSKKILLRFYCAGRTNGISLHGHFLMIGGFNVYITLLYLRIV